MNERGEKPQPPSQSEDENAEGEHTRQVTESQGDAEIEQIAGELRKYV